MIEERRFLAWLPLFAGLFFASTAVIPGGDGGAGDGGDTGGGDAGDAGTSDDTSVGDETDDTGAEGDTSADTEGISEESEATDEDTGAEGKISAKTTTEEIKKALEKLRESDPEAAKTLRKQFFKQEQALNGFRESFKTPAEAVAARDLIESIGGETGITEMQSEVKEYALELSKMAEGDVSVVDDLARDFPKGLVRLTPHAVARLKQVDSAAYTQRIAAPGTVDVLNMTAGSLNGTTPLHAMDRLIELIADGKQEAANGMAKALRQWANDVTAYARNTEARRTEIDDDDPDRKALNAERAEVQTEKQRIFTQRVSGAIMQRLSRVVDQHLAPYLKKAKLTPVQRKETNNAIRNRVTRMLERDKSYQTRFKALLEKGDVTAIERFVGSQSSMRAPKAAAAEWEARGYGGTRTASNGTKTATVASMGAKPDPSNVDWTKDPRRLRYTGDGTTGEYTDKKGNVRRFKW
jgi:hypothetical protein